MKRQEMSSQEYRQQIQGRQPKRSKYGNRKTEYAGRLYDSQKEAAWAKTFDEWLKRGLIKAWIPQVSIPVTPASRIRYRADFLVIRKDDGVAVWYDVKGHDTPASRMKRQLLREWYGIEVQIV